MAELIPAIINQKAGTAAHAARAIADVGGFEVREVGPDQIRATALELAERRPKRIVVCGGDGSLCTVAHVLAKTGIELAIVPGGTLNHLAKHLGLPDDPREAAALAHTGITRTVDAGRLNDLLFLNTSSVGAYEIFVRRRDRLEKHWGYHFASIIAGLQILLRTPLTTVRVEVDGVEKIYRTPLVFVGVGERELRIPSLGRRMDHGKRGLHLMIVRNRTGARLASLALQAAAKGSDAMARTPSMDGLIVDRCTIELAGDTASIDGELITVEPPLEYEFLRDAVVVVSGERRELERNG